MQSWDLCRRTIPEKRSPEDWALRNVIEACVLQAALEDEIAVTNEDPTKPDNVADAPPPDAGTMSRVGQLRSSNG